MDTVGDAGKEAYYFSRWFEDGRVTALRRSVSQTADTYREIPFRPTNAQEVAF
jgi:hypothetical protein